MSEWGDILTKASEQPFWCPDPTRPREPIFADGTAILLGARDIRLVMVRDGRVVSQVSLSADQADEYAESLRRLATELRK